MSSIATIALVGGHPALDFANTAGWHASDERLEHLTSYKDWLAWLKRSDLKSLPLSQLSREAEKHPARAARALEEIIGRRELIYRIFAAIAQHRDPAPKDLDQLHRAQVEALGAAEPRWESGQLTLVWKDGPAVLLAPLHLIILAARDLLGSPQLDRLRQCDNHPCGWLFLDQSKNGSRRWCSSSDCGNLIRVKRFRDRQPER